MQRKKIAQDAKDAITKARSRRLWRISNLKRHHSRTLALITMLDPLRKEPEVSRLLERIYDNPTKIDSRELHYIQRRYLDGEPLASAQQMDALFESILTDPNALVHQAGGFRYQVYSPREGWVGIIEPDGTRVSLYPYLNDDFGEPLCVLSDLIH